MVKIAPSILSADFSALGAEVRRAEEGGADMIHLDVMDGHFVPSITFGSLVVKAIRVHTSLPLDVHLMVEQPERHVEEFARAGADIISVHAETCVHLHRTVQKIREAGAKAGVAVNPATPLYVLEYVLNDVDLVLIMSVNPGFGGQAFIPGSVGKIAQARQLLSKLDREVELEVDGGIGPETAPLAVNAGASVLVAGSAVYGSSDVGKAIAALRASLTTCSPPKV